MVNGKWFLAAEVMIIALIYATAVMAGQGGERKAFAKNLPWKIMSGEHFIIYYLNEDSFAKTVLSEAEKYYRRIAAELGYGRHSQFWLWENRVNIFVYPDQKGFLSATQQPEWSHGMADYTSKEIISYAWSSDFVESLLPHEMAHLIFRDFIGFKGDAPLWLDEGVAQWAEIPKREEVNRAVLEYYKQNKLLTIEDMMRLDVRYLKDWDHVHVRKALTRSGESGVLFLDVDGLVQTYYLESVALISFMTDRFGSTRFTQFCRELRDGLDVEGALRKTYPAQMENLADFEKKWREYLESKISEGGTEND